MGKKDFCGLNDLLLLLLLLFTTAFEQSNITAANRFEIKALTKTEKMGKAYGRNMLKKEKEIVGKRHKEREDVKKKLKIKKLKKGLTRSRYNNYIGTTMGGKKKKNIKNPTNLVYDFLSPLSEMLQLLVGLAS